MITQFILFEKVSCVSSNLTNNYNTSGWPLFSFVTHQELRQISKIFFELISGDIECDQFQIILKTF